MLTGVVVVRAIWIDNVPVDVRREDDGHNDPIDSDDLTEDDSTLSAKLRT